jgi:hypothetical protein
MLVSWDPHDPELETPGWRIQVKGWAEQASRAPSSTAGWGISQAAIEEGLWFSLAAASVGRGWHAVRTAAGTYGFEIVLRPVN